MRSFVHYFQAGTIHKERECYVFKVSKFSDLQTKIIPFFKQYPILGNKAKDFNDWQKILEILNHKPTLTKEGLDIIKSIKAGMNSGRKFNVNN